MIEILEPATEQVLARLEEATVADADAAVAAAAVAAPAWAATPAAERARVLTRLARLLEEDGERLADLEARNGGKPIAAARGTVEMTVDTFRYFAGAPERLLGSTIPVAGGVDLTFWEPLGVVGIITPWNYPLSIAGWKVAPALAAGNAVVLKPAELTPLTALRLRELAVEAGVPEGAFQVVVGRGSVVGQRIVDHPAVAKISFTGSTAVGIRIAASAAQQVKRVTLELGGKSANVVFADADLETAAAAVPGIAFANAGQDCCSRSRLLVQRSVLDRFLAELEPHVRALRVGAPYDEDVQVGPVISAQQRASVLSYLDGTLPVACAAERVPDGPGFWVAPTVTGPVSNDHRAAREEIFGPVTTVIPFEDEAEAIAIANDSPYGLSGSIWTRDGSRALRVARAMETGTLAVNAGDTVRVGTPFGGFKQSGYGRELGPDALHDYAELKNVFIATGG